MPDRVPKAATRHKSSYSSSLIAGGVAGTAVDLCLYPIDTLKTRLQSSSGFAATGGFRGIYAGVGSVVVGSAPGAALFFVSYESCKRFLRNRAEAASSIDGLLGVNSSNSSFTSFLHAEPVEHMIAASIGEVAACAVRVPTEVVKQRAQALQFSSSLQALQSILSQRRSMGAVHVWKELYRGWNVTVLREVPFTIIQFPLWEAMKARRKLQTGSSTTPAYESAIFGSIAGAVAAAITTPLDVLKTRIMLATEKQRTYSLVSQILRESGPRAFLSGIGPRIIWISVGGSIFLGTYQWAANILS